MIADDPGYEALDQDTTYATAEYGPRIAVPGSIGRGGWHVELAIVDDVEAARRGWKR